MASEIRVDKINSLSGVGTVTLSPTGVDIAGITTAETLKATTGIVTTLTATTGIVTTFEATTGNITTLRAPTGIVTSFTTNTLTANSTAKVGSGVTLSPDGDVFVTGVTTSSTVKVGGGVTITESGIEASGIGITCANLNGGQFGRRNKVINGAMQIAQRSTSVSSITSGNYYVCDRWRLGYGTAGTWTLSQSTDTPDNFGKSLKMDCTAANTSLSAGSNLQLIQYFEGQDLQDVAKGTSSAKEITVSFYVKTNKTGTYVVELMDHDNSNRHCSKSYTVSDTNWNRYTLTFPADTTGALDDDANKSFEVGFWLVAGGTFQGSSLRQTWGTLSQGSRAVGQVNLADSTSNEWYLTGVQLEVGSQATDFEHHRFGEELALCQRYLFKNIFEAGENGCNYGKAYSSTELFSSVRFPVAMRATPTIIAYSNSGTAGQVHKLGSPDTAYTSIDRLDAYGGMRINSSAGAWGTGDTDMYSFTFQADAEL